MKNKSYKYNYLNKLTTRTPFKNGVFSSLNLYRRPIKVNKILAVSNADALYQDWSSIGKDLESAIEEAKLSMDLDNGRKQ